MIYILAIAANQMLLTWCKCELLEVVATAYVWIPPTFTLGLIHQKKGNKIWPCHKICSETALAGLLHSVIHHCNSVRTSIQTNGQIVYDWGHIVLHLHLFISQRINVLKTSPLEHLLDRKPKVIIKVIWRFKDEARNNISEGNHPNNFIFVAHHVNPVDGLGRQNADDIAERGVRLAGCWRDYFSQFLIRYRGNRAHEFLHCQLPESDKIKGFMSLEELNSFISCYWNQSLCSQQC